MLFKYTETRTEIIAFILNAKHTEFITGEPPICTAKPFRKIRNIVQRGMDIGEIVPYDCWISTSVIFGGAFRMILMRLEGLIERPLPEYYEQIIDATWKTMKVPVAPTHLRKLVSNE